MTGSFNTIYRSDGDAQVMQWMSPLERGNRHESVRAGRFGGVGGWLSETREFRGLRRGGGGVGKAALFCLGDPGVGKKDVR